MPPVRSASRSLQCLSDPVVVQADVEEAGAGDLGRAGDRGEVDAAAISWARSRGFLPERLGQRHAAVGLVIAELGVGRGADGRAKAARSAPSGKAGPNRLTQVCQ